MPFDLQLLDVARTLEGYGTYVFPHCACDARKSGHVIVSISLNSFRLQACSDQGDKEVRSAPLVHVRIQQAHLSYGYFILGDNKQTK